MSDRFRPEKTGYLTAVDVPYENLTVTPGAQNKRAFKTLKASTVHRFHFYFGYWHRSFPHLTLMPSLIIDCLISIKHHSLLFPATFKDYQVRRLQVHGEVKDLPLLNRML